MSLDKEDFFKRTSEINIELSDEEINKLTEHYLKNEINQFITICVLKVYKDKDFKEDNDKVFRWYIGLMQPIVDKYELPIVSSEGIKTLANILYKALYALDIKKIEGDDF